MNAGNEIADYESPLRFHENRIRAAAVYCSDGRLGDQVDDFLKNALNLPQYHHLAVPGAPPASPATFLPTGKNGDWSSTCISSSVCMRWSV